MISFRKGLRYLTSMNRETGPEDPRAENALEEPLCSEGLARYDPPSSGHSTGAA